MMIVWRMRCPPPKLLGNCPMATVLEPAGMIELERVNWVVEEAVMES